jgi:hypothetical protein
MGWDGLAELFSSEDKTAQPRESSREEQRSEASGRKNKAEGGTTEFI